MSERRRWGARTSILAAALLGLVLAVAESAFAAARCAPDGADAAAVASARATVESECECAFARSAAAWRSCVRNALAPLTGSTLSPACARHVLRVETRSTCGRSGRVACCRTNAAGRTTPALRPDGRCLAPPRGSACESTSPFLEDACTSDGCNETAVCGDFTVEAGEQCDPPDGTYCSTSCTTCSTELGCVAPSACGNGVQDPGEQCDPPNGTTCSTTCDACAPAASGELLIGCSASGSAPQAAALDGALLVAFTDVTPGGGVHTVARRLGNDGSPIDATPVLVSDVLSPSGGLGGSVQAASADGSDFYVGWTTGLYWYNNQIPTVLWGGRRLPASGAPTAGAEQLWSDAVFGACSSRLLGPLQLAPKLDGSGFRSTMRVSYSCGHLSYGETLVGVGNFFSFPPPGNLSSGPAPIVRGSSDVAAVWWNALVSQTSPTPVVEQFLAATFVDAPSGSLLSLTPGSSNVWPALAAVGDTFVAVFASGNEVRAVRFSRATGVLDPPGGLLLATGTSPVAELAAAGDGSTVLVAWSENDASGSTIRAIRVAPDGTLPSPTPVTIASTTAGAGFDVAANASTGLVAYARAEGASHSVRAVLLPVAGAPSPPTPTATPSPERCVCACDVKYSGGSGCPGIHPCIVAGVVPATNAACEPFNAIGTGCQRVANISEFLQGAPVPVLNCRF